MNKLTIPTILVATVMVAGIFAFMPVQQATTVHTTILASVEHLNVQVMPGDASVGDTPLWTLANGEDTEIITVLVTNSAGIPVTTLIAGDFTGVADPRDASAAATLVFLGEISDGLYTLTLDSGDFGGLGFVEYVLIVTVDDVNDDDTTEVGTGALYISIEVLA